MNTNRFRSGEYIMKNVIQGGYNKRDILIALYQNRPIIKIVPAISDKEKLEFYKIVATYESKELISKLLEKEATLIVNSHGEHFPYSISVELMEARSRLTMGKVETYSIKILPELKQIMSIIKEILSSSKDKKVLGRQREEFEDNILKEANHKSKIKSLARRKEVEEAAKERWPEVKKKIEEMNRRAGLK